MRKSCQHIFLLIVLIVPGRAMAQDSLSFSGELIGWGNLNFSNKLPLWMGGRYIPALNYAHRFLKQKMIDFEVSGNLYGSFGFHPFDTATTSGKIKPYRIWARYSTRQFEFRIGLQKINFGSAYILRPLMWFDRIDPRDPLQLTDGVWGALGRYYFLNNANLWLWCLYGNKNPKGWEIAETSQKFPEIGGRLQYPVPKGDLALTYHHRVADTRQEEAIMPVYDYAPENRIGIDGRWDLGIGLWFEGSWISNSRELAAYKNQEFLNLGADNTFGIGNGLHAVVEQLFVSYNEKATTWSNGISFTGLSLNYPVGIFDNLSAIVYYDWSHSSFYNFINWQRQFDKITLYFMSFWNPENYKLPLRTGSDNLLSGKGIQIMVVYNH